MGRTRGRRKIVTGVHAMKVVRVGSTALAYLLHYELEWEHRKWRLMSVIATVTAVHSLFSKCLSVVCILSQINKVHTHGPRPPPQLLTLCFNIILTSTPRVCSSLQILYSLSCVLPLSPFLPGLILETVPSTSTSCKIGERC
jgi:hypothetical protein